METKVDIREIMHRKVTLFESADNAKPTADIYVGNWLRMGEQYKEKIEQCRAIYEASGKSDDYRELKKTLPAVTIGGTFSYRREDKLKQSSNLIAIDIDDVEEDIEFLKQRIFGIRFVAAIQKSVSGHGIWVLIPYEDGLTYKEVQDALSADFASWGIKIDDPGTSGIGRLRFLSIDDSLMIKRTFVTLYGSKLKAQKEYEAEHQEEEQEEPSEKIDISRTVQSIAEDSLLADDRFCFAAAWQAITHGYVSNTANNMRDWLGQLSTFSTLGSVGLRLAIELSRRSSSYTGDKDVERAFVRMSRTNSGSRQYFTRYFAFCKELWGKDWISKVKESYQKTLRK